MVEIFIQVNHNETQLLLKNTSPYLLIETEALVYTVESLVAEFGGTLGLFLGFSFMTLWDVVEFVVDVFPTIVKFLDQII